MSDIYGANHLPQLRFERSISELVPTVFIVAAYVVENPDAISMMLKAIEAFCRTRFVVARKNKDVKLKVIKQKEGESYMEVNYEGPVSGLREIKPILETD